VWLAGLVWAVLAGLSGLAGWAARLDGMGSVRRLCWAGLCWIEWGWAGVCWLV